MTPFVTVLMAAYNAEKWVGEAVESILKQAYTNFEFIIVDDGSTDGTLRILKSVDDERVHVIENSSNIGLIRSLNKGLDLAKGAYIARMDADDISLPDRLEKQVAFMEANPEVGASSAWQESFGDGTRHVWKTPERHDRILAKMFSNSSMWHPVSILRTSVLQQHGIRYEEEFYRSEDYRLWVRIAGVSRLANLPEVLLMYRLHDSQETKQPNSSQKIREELLGDFLGRPPTPAEIMHHRHLHFARPFSDPETMNEVRGWIAFLSARNRETGRYTEPEFSDSLESAFQAAKRHSFFHLIRNKKRFTPAVIYYLYLSGRNYYRLFRFSILARITVKSLIFWPNHGYREE